MNKISLIGVVIGKYQLPYLNLNAIELLCDEQEIIVHLPKALYDLVELNEKNVGIKGHLYNFEGRMYVYADSVLKIGA